MTPGRIISITRRMAAGEVFYFSRSPRITKREVQAIEKLGFSLQIESPLHESTMIYPLWIEEFRQQAKNIDLGKVYLVVSEKGPKP